MQMTDIEMGGTAVLALDGRLDSVTAPAVEARLVALLARGPVVADLAAVRYVSSAGLRVLLKAAKDAKAAGTRFAVCGMQAAVREVFEVSGFDRVIPAFPTAAEATGA
jgi:anti-anti-sigma factor